MILRLTEFDEVLLFARNGHICKHASAQRKIVKDQKASVKKKQKTKSHKIPLGFHCIKNCYSQKYTTFSYPFALPEH